MTKHNKKIILFSFLHTDPGFSYSLCTTGLKNEIQISSKMKYRRILTSIVIIFIIITTFLLITT